MKSHSKNNIVVTGAAGFIASNLAKALNNEGFNDLVLVDKFDVPTKKDNLTGALFAEKVEREVFPEWLIKNADTVDFLFHIGARTDTTEFDFKVLEQLNLKYSETLWRICTEKQIPFLYASSAATYGLGTTSMPDARQAFDDNESEIKDLKPLNPYGLSKQLFDVFVLNEKQRPPFWAGLKFFNVYGPHEAHKGRMASVIFHAYNQIKETGKMKLFQSHRPDYENGEQLRDFIYVDDVIEACLFFYKNRKSPGIYNIGTGKARTFNDLAKAVFSSLSKPEQIEYIPIPEDIREKYQYFTEAKMDKLRAAGFHHNFTTLEEGVKKYVRFLKAGG